MVGYQGSVLYCTKLVIAPRKNLVLTFCGQVRKDDTQGPAGVQYALNWLCDKLTFEIGDQDYISGNTFLCGDGSQLCLQADGSFCYYQSAEDHENQYYEGEYEVYYGQAAMDKVASMTEYGLTMEELERVLSANMNGYIPGGSRPSDYLYATGELEDNRERYQICLDTFYAVILHNQRSGPLPGGRGRGRKQHALHRLLPPGAGNGGSDQLQRYVLYAVDVPGRDHLMKLEKQRYLCAD